MVDKFDVSKLVNTSIKSKDTSQSKIPRPDFSYLTRQAEEIQRN